MTPFDPLRPPPPLPPQPPVLMTEDMMEERQRALAALEPDRRVSGVIVIECSWAAEVRWLT